MKKNKYHLLIFSLLFCLTELSLAQYSQTVRLNYLDANRIKRSLYKVIAYSQQVYGGGGGSVGDYVEGTISTGAGNGLNFQDVTVELIDLTGDTTNPQARLYIYSSQRDREVTLSKGNSELVDNFRVRLDKADLNRQEADITIRQAGNSNSIGNGQHPPGHVSVTADNATNSVTISATYQADLQNLLLWVKQWDQPQNQQVVQRPSTSTQRSSSSSSDISSQPREDGNAILQAVLDYQMAYDELKKKYEAKQITFTDFDLQSKQLERLKNDALNKSYRNN